MPLLCVGTRRIFVISNLKNEGETFITQTQRSQTQKCEVHCKTCCILLQISKWLLLDFAGCSQKGNSECFGVQVIESTGVVVTPYMEYPQLLGMLLQMLSEGSPQARLEVLKVHLECTFRGFPAGGAGWGPRSFEVA